MALKAVEFTVYRHESGRHTLTERSDSVTKDPPVGPLFANNDKGEFYRAVARRLASAAEAGLRFTYRDDVS